MGIHTFFDCVRAEIVCADCAAFLNALTADGVKIRDVTFIDELTVYVTISRHHKEILKNAAEKHGVTVKIKNYLGLYWTGTKLFKRPVLIGFFLLSFFLSVYLPTRVLFLTVDGNVTVPTRLILEVAADCGIKFGAKRVTVRSEMMKNALLEKMPQLQWAGINTSGCTATISVRERTIRQDENTETKGIYSIVASRDGIIQNCTVYNGNPLCAVGQAVKEGQVLVSGYLDLGIVTQGTRAEAEIRALTFRTLDVISLNSQSERGHLSNKKTNFSIRIGKKVIKFYKDSGNLDATCAKIYSEKYVCLPGGFQLPVSFITEQVYCYESEQKTSVPTAEDGWLEAYAQTYVKEKMIAGQIIFADSEISTNGETSRLQGRYTCIEQIGLTLQEQLPKDGTYGRENREFGTH